MASPLIVTAELGASDFAWLDALRRRHYPAERNRVPAHLTLFRTLPPSAEAEVRRAMRSACSAKAPPAIIDAPMDLGGGVALRLRSSELDTIREEMIEHLHGLLTAQDNGGWVPHVTIQNKVERGVARALLRSLEGFEPRRIAIRGLLLFAYKDGPWEPRGGHRFRNS